MKFETRIRGNPYICTVVEGEDPKFTLQNMKGADSPITLTAQEKFWLAEEWDIALYADKRGIDY